MYCTDTHTQIYILPLYLPQAVESTHAQHTRSHSHIFSETKGRADCNIFLHFKKVASVKMINEGSCGRACILTLDCTRASRAVWTSTGFRAAFRLLLLHRRSQHANYKPRQWLAVWNYYQQNKNVFNTKGEGGLWPDITSGWKGESVVFLKQVLAAKRLIANFPEVNPAHRCENRTSDRSPSDCWCRLAQGYFQTSFITSSQHQLQNGGGEIDGWRGLVNMRDWNESPSVCCCGGWRHRKIKKQALTWTRFLLLTGKCLY